MYNEINSTLDARCVETMKIAVIDGQGGGMGRAIVESLKERYGNEVVITALGTNTLATSAMLKAGADEGATGENAIVYNSSKADVIMGAIGIVAANSMLGELTPAMAAAVAASPAKKVLIPVSKCNIQVAGVPDMAMQRYIDEAVNMIGTMGK
jgi:NAD(P)-dependent dehydrogenase (short-subunit alcohol dehydrogenase family)